MSLKHIKFCVEKTLPSHSHIIKSIHAMKNDKDKHKKRAAFFSSKLWPANSVINIGFLNDGKGIPWTSISDLKISGRPIDPMCITIQGMTAINAVKKVITERLQPIVGNGIKINFLDDNTKCNVRVNFDESNGSWAYLGTDHNSFTDSKEPTVNFGWIDAATIEHEFGHVLGMIHEHQNPHGNTIQWNKEKVYTWAKETQGWDQETTDENILNKYEQNQINGSDYDPLSVMLYFFPAELTLNNQGTDQNLRLSGDDVTFINKMYPGTIETPAEFYKKVYNEDITSTPGTYITNTHSIKNILKIPTNIQELIRLILIIIIIYFLIKIIF
jgi:hypothetical protein